MPQWPLEANARACVCAKSQSGSAARHVRRTAQPNPRAVSIFMPSGVNRHGKSDKAISNTGHGFRAHLLYWRSPAAALRRRDGEDPSWPVLNYVCGGLDGRTARSCRCCCGLHHAASLRSLSHGGRALLKGRDGPLAAVGSTVFRYSFFSRGSCARYPIPQGLRSEDENEKCREQPVRRRRHRPENLPAVARARAWTRLHHEAGS